MRGITPVAGNTDCDQGNYDAAIAEVRELFRLNPSWGKGHDFLAKALMAKEDYPAAIAELKLAILQHPTGSAEHRVLGQALLLSGQQKEAVRELRLAVALDPDSPLAHHYLGTALFQAEQWSAAAEEFQQALRLQPTATNHYSLAACLMSIGNYDQALAELDTAARLEPGQDLYRARKQELLKLMKATKTR